MQLTKSLNSQFQQASYRSEIDGLRALAALAVLLFHFFPYHLPSGYLGVDLFFVISGYVITNQLQKNLETGSFSFAGFYKRRIKRILPLTFVVTAAVLIAGSIILMRSDLESAGKSAFATSTFWANIFFWRDGGYFGGADKLKPLLHMWSLAVEEQFYIFFPALMWVLVARFKARALTLITVLGVLSVLSFGAQIALIQMGGSSPAFFLMPTRAWQFGVGALAALVVGYGALGKSPVWSAAALAALLFFLWLPDFDLTAQIGVTLAAGVYLLIGGNGNPTDRFLSSPVMKYLGLRSFSIYLWHWPIVAFSSYIFVGEAPMIWKLFGLALTFILSEASFRLIEKPFRYTLPLKATLGLIATSVAIMAAAYVWAMHGAKSNFETRIASQIQTNFRCNLSDYVPYGASRACILKSGAKDGNVAIIGNSHAQMYAPAILAQYANSDVGVTLIPLNSCTPTPNVNVSASCAASARANLDALLSDPAIETVYIGTTYEHDELVEADGTKVDDMDGNRFAGELIALIDAIEAKGKKVRLIGPIMKPGFDFASEVSRKLRFGWLSEQQARTMATVPRSDFEAKFGPMIDALTQRLGSDLIRTDKYLCDDVRCRFADENSSYFADDNHLGKYGVEVVTPAFKPQQ